MRPLHKKRKRRANAASLIVLINERTTRPHVFAVPKVRRRVYELFGAQGSGERGAKAGAGPALTSFQFAVACTLVALLTASALPAPKNLHTLCALFLFLSASASPRFSPRSCGPCSSPVDSLSSCLFDFVVCCIFLICSFFGRRRRPTVRSSSTTLPALGRDTAYMRLSHSRLFTLRTCFIYFLINLMRQFCVAFCGALHTFRGRLRSDCVCSSATRNRKTQAHIHTRTHTHNVIRKLLHFVYSQRSCRSWRSM